MYKTYRRNRKYPWDSEIEGVTILEQVTNEWGVGVETPPLHYSGGETYWALTVGHEALCVFRT
jgi:hypothetical protein